MTTIVLPEYVTLKNDNLVLTVSTDGRGILRFVADEQSRPSTVFEVVNIPHLFQTVALKSCVTGKFWKRSEGNPNWINAAADDVATGDSFQFQVQDATNTVFSFWSPKDAMFLRRYTDTGNKDRLCAFSRPVEGGGADGFTRFSVQGVEKP